MTAIEHDTDEHDREEVGAAAGETAESVAIEFCGEWFRPVAGTTYAIGRDADLVIDTSRLTVHQLAARVAHAYGGEEAGTLRVQVMSFGFKNGVPLDADFVFDVRFLPNPHWVPELRPQTGLSEAVSGYVLSQEGANEFLDDLQGMFRIVAPGYLREGKRQVTVAIGCTGGKHRSTAMTEATARRLREEGMQVSVLHRDLGLE